MKYPCELIKDLIPLRADGVCSKVSAQVVEEHLAECEECRRIAKAGEKTVSLSPELQAGAVIGKKLFRHVKSLYFVLGTIGYLMLGGWVLFLIIAVCNPQLGVLGSMSITYFLYSVYILCMCGLIVMSCILRPKNIRPNGQIKPHAVFLAVAWICFGLWWISFFIHNLCGWDSPIAVLRHFDAVAPLFCLGWLLFLLVVGIFFFFDRSRARK